MKFETPRVFFRRTNILLFPGDNGRIRHTIGSLVRPRELKSVGLVFRFVGGETRTL